MGPTANIDASGIIPNLLHVLPVRKVSKENVGLVSTYSDIVFTNW